MILLLLWIPLLLENYILLQQGSNGPGEVGHVGVGGKGTLSTEQFTWILQDNLISPLSLNLSSNSKWMAKIKSNIFPVIKKWDCFVLKKT